MTSSDTILWIAQSFAAVAFAVKFWSDYSISRQVTIAGRGVSALTYTFEYALLGMWSVAGVSSLNAVRGFAMVGASSRRARSVLLVLFVFAHTAVFVFVTGSWESWLTVLPLVSAVLSTVAFSFERVTRIKALTVLTSLIWIIYFSTYGLWVNAAGDTLSAILAAIAWRRASRIERSIAAETVHAEAA